MNRYTKVALSCQIQAYTLPFLNIARSYVN